MNKTKKNIYFVTGNQGKFEEVKSFIDKNEPNIILKQFKTEIPEIQTLDQKAIAIQKAIKAWEIVQKPLIIDDSAIYFENYYKFPGIMTKYVFKGLGFEGMVKLVEEGNKAIFLLYLVYINGPKSFKIFEGKCSGNLTKPIKFYGNTNLPYDCFFIPFSTNKTYAQMRKTKEGEKYFHRIKALKKFIKWWN
ncbi:hypothetical protein KAT08_03075 [Candidatus Babeliales bacterium]|nr:hypothetical protein [Candidatus Babeliales bacterium]